MPSTPTTRTPVTLLLLACIALASCTRAPQPIAGDAHDAHASHATPPVRTPAEDAPAEAATRARHALQQRRHDDAMRDAVAAVHGYLRHAGSRERAQAESRWAYNRLPPASEEAGLRTLPLRALRIENGTPRALDAEPVPASIEVPVRLRATLEDGSTHRYTGWYRVRRNPVTTTWELTAASLQPVLR